MSIQENFLKAFTISILLSLSSSLKKEVRREYINSDLVPSVHEEVIRRKVLIEKTPILGICLGMQLMCKATEEGNTQGLSIFDDASVVKFDDTLKIPHMGWNTIEETNGMLNGLKSDVYFVHSYYAPKSIYTAAICNYAVPFSAALEKDNFLGCQFHPEKSGKAGEEILKRFLEEKK